MKKALAILLCAAIAAAAGCGAQPEQTQAPSGVEAAGNAEAAETEAAETESEQQKYRRASRGRLRRVYLHDAQS